MRATLLIFATLLVGSCASSRICDPFGLVDYCASLCEDRGMCAAPEATCSGGEWSCQCQPCRLDLGVSVDPPDAGRSDAFESDALSSDADIF